MAIYTVQERSSDHNPIILEVGENNYGDVDEHRETNIKKIDWNHFIKYLDTNLCPIPRIEDEEDMETPIQALEDKIIIEAGAKRITKARFNKYGKLHNQTRDN